MAWYFPQSGDDLPTLAASDDVFIAPQVFLHESIDDVDPTGTGTDGHEIIVAGTIAWEGYYVIRLGMGSFGSNSVTVETTGQVRSFDESTILLYGSDQKIINHGLITQHGPAAGNQAVYFNCLNLTPNTTSSFVNTGTIDADGHGVYHHNSAETLIGTNSGTIRGGLNAFISTGSSKDQITNSGRMIGDVDLGGGDDLYDGRLGTVQGSILGGTGNDRLLTGLGNNALFGQDGNDTLAGGVGADQLSGGTGVDIAYYATATGAVVVSLLGPSLNAGEAAGDTFNSVENLIGSNFDDYLYGNNAANSISGGAGNDIIKGFAGNDRLAGGTGADIFIFNTALNVATNVDTITDFNPVADTIWLENAIFTALAAAGMLAAGTFRANTTGLAQDADDRIIYESDTGNLSYDGNGNAAGGGILFAKITPGLTLTNADFAVI